MKQKERIELWRGLVQAQQQSGQSVRQWCIENHRSATNFYHWRRLFGTMGAEIPEFIRVEMEEQTFPFDVTLPNDVVVHVPGHFDADSLRRLILVLQST